MEQKKRKTDRIWGISKIYANAITCKISPPHALWGISSTLPYFLLNRNFLTLTQTSNPNRTYPRYATNLERESTEGKKVLIKLQELQILLTDQRAKVDSLNNYTVKAKEYTAEIKKLNECAGTS